IQTWGHFISTTNEQLSEQLNLWSSITDIPLDVSFTGFDELATSLEEADETQTPDIIMMLHARPHQFADNLMDVSDIAEAVGRANGGWYNIAREACEVDGVWRAMPWFFAPQAMVYRSDLYAEAGYDAFPSTMEELLEAGTILKTMGYPLGFSVGPADGDGNNFCLTVLWSFGGNIVNPDNEIVLDSPETRLALEFVQQLYQDAMLPEVVSWDDGANNTAFLAGEISTTNNASSILWAAQQNDVAFASTINHASYPEDLLGQFNMGKSIVLAF
ncbi:MAG: extracellular solute-binding protein, partial [Chloroflexota bacterium]